MIDRTDAATRIFETILRQSCEISSLTHELQTGSIPSEHARFTRMLADLMAFHLTEVLTPLANEFPDLKARLKSLIHDGGPA